MPSRFFWISIYCSDIEFEKCFQHPNQSHRWLSRKDKYKSTRRQCKCSIVGYHHGDRQHSTRCCNKRTLWTSKNCWVSDKYDSFYVAVADIATLTASKEVLFAEVIPGRSLIDFSWEFYTFHQNHRYPYEITCMCFRTIVNRSVLKCDWPAKDSFP